MFKRPPQLFRDNVFSDESRAAQAEKLSRALAQISQTHHEQG
jgi:predicted methyltransferase MtxX (methanogen marker protein 4)